MIGNIVARVHFSDWTISTALKRLPYTIYRTLYCTRANNKNDEEKNLAKSGTTSSSSKDVVKPVSQKFSESPAYRPNLGLTPRLAERKAIAEFEAERQAPPLSYYDSIEFRSTKNSIIVFCFFFFLLYVFMIREPNDFDEWLEEELNMPLWKRVPAMEKQVLEQLIQEGKLYGKDTKDYERRLKELQYEIEQHALRQLGVRK